MVNWSKNRNQLQWLKTCSNNTLRFSSTWEVATTRLCYEPRYKAPHYYQICKVLRFVLIVGATIIEIFNDWLKAANPGCVLGDFVRWYSPRDWVETEEKQVDPDTKEEKTVQKCELSHRMKIPGNMWLEVWETARPIPVRKQKRLFDDTKEAENVNLNFLFYFIFQSRVNYYLPDFRLVEFVISGPNCRAHTPGFILFSDFHVL